MKHILTINEASFGRTPQKDQASYRQRHAVRAIVLDSENRVYLMHRTRRPAYKLPGGGVEEGESLEQALRRELMEEVGVEVEVIDEIGELIEYRDVAKMKQFSYCYLVRQVGAKVQNNLDAEEIADGMQEILTDDIDQAIELVEANDARDVWVEYVTLRDAAILRAAKPLLAELV